jgi:hypothetical protein
MQLRKEQEMSKAGRLQDALHELLWGYEDHYGKFFPGELHDLGYERVHGLVDAICDVATLVYR